MSNRYRILAFCLLIIAAAAFILGGCAANPPEWLTQIEPDEVPAAIRDSAADDSGGRRLIWHAYHQQDDGREIAIAAYPDGDGWRYWVGMYEQAEGSPTLVHSVTDALPAEEVPFSGAWAESETGVVAAGLLQDPDVLRVIAQTNAMRSLLHRALGSFWYIWPDPPLLPGAAPGDEVWHRIVAMGHDRDERHELPINPLPPDHEPDPKDYEPRWVSPIDPETVPQDVRDQMSEPGSYHTDHIWYAFGQRGDQALAVCSSFMPLRGLRSLRFTLFAVGSDGAYTELDTAGSGPYPYPRQHLQVGHGFGQSGSADGVVTATLSASGVIVDESAARIVGVTDAGNRAEFEPINTFFYLLVPNARPASEEPVVGGGGCGSEGCSACGTENPSAHGGTREAWTEIWAEDKDGNVLHTWQPREAHRP